MKKYKFKKNFDIGSLEAETDPFLEEAFVQKPELELILDTKNNKSLLLGRTGIGKSALLQYVYEKEEYVVKIDPTSLSLKYLSNSTIIRYFQELDIKLDLFYKVLWKHVFIVELIKLHFGNSAEKSMNFIEWVSDRLSGNNKRRNAAIEYLRSWQDEFWESTEYRIREVEQSVSKKFKEELGGEATFNKMLDFIASIKVKKSEGSEDAENLKIIQDVKHKAQRVVNDVQMTELREIFNLVRDEFAKRNKKRHYFIIIDDLDTEWVSEEIVYELILSLIDTIKDFRAIKNLKILPAIRTNILEETLYRNTSRGRQREKFQSLYLDITWTQNELAQMLNQRLKLLMKGEYTNQSPTIEEILPASRGKDNTSGFDYIVERSLNRPRDVIDFFNRCIKLSDGKTKICWEVIKQAETNYSSNRLKALHDEWLENYGNIRLIYSFLKGGSYKFTINDIKDKAEQKMLSIIQTNEYVDLKGKALKCVESFKETMDIMPTLKIIIGILHEIGMLGVKASPECKVEYVSTYYTLGVFDEEIAVFHVHKMFSTALNIRSN